MKVVDVNHISKTYGVGKDTVLALDDVSFSIAKGELFGLIGPDGAGKTSLFRILTTVLSPDNDKKGTASVEGLDVIKDFKKIRQTVGYMPGKFSLYMDLTIQENIHFFATIFNTSLQQNYDLIKEIYIQLEPFKDRRAGKLSGGMKQKLALCCALIHKPTVLFLDEPTTGVDPVSRKEFWEMLQRLKVQGITILVSTPYMDEANLCDRIALIQAGKILSIDSPQGIVSSHAKTLYAIRGDRMYPLLKDLRAYPQTQTCYSFGEFHHLTLKNSFQLSAVSFQQSTQDINQYLTAKGHTGLIINPMPAGIEDVFMSLM